MVELGLKGTLNSLLTIAGWNLYMLDVWSPSTNQVSSNHSWVNENRYLQQLSNCKSQGPYNQVHTSKSCLKIHIVGVSFIY